VWILYENATRLQDISGGVQMTAAGGTPGLGNVMRQMELTILCAKKDDPFVRHIAVHVSKFTLDVANVRQRR
jgi:hypothetical protein